MEFISLMKVGLTMTVTARPRNTCIHGPVIGILLIGALGECGQLLLRLLIALTPSRISTFINNTNTPCPLTLACCGVPEFHLNLCVGLCQSRWRELPFTVTDTVQQHHGWTFQILKAAESRGNFKVPVVILINWYQLSESISSAQRRRYPHRLVGKFFGVSLYSLRWFITTEDEYHRLNKLFGCDFQETGLENVLLSLRWLREVLRTYYWSVYLASFDYCYKSSYLKFYLPDSEGREFSILPLTIRNVTHKS